MSSHSLSAASTVLLVLLAKGILNDLLGLTSCHCDNRGVVLLIFLGWELRVLYHCTMCTRHPDLVSLIFMPSIHFHSNFYIKFYLFTVAVALQKLVIKIKGMVT